MHVFVVGACVRGCVHVHVAFISKLCLLVLLRAFSLPFHLLALQDDVHAALDFKLVHLVFVPSFSPSSRCSFGVFLVF
jgi:hypothetical protein